MNEMEMENAPKWAVALMHFKSWCEGLVLYNQPNNQEKEMEFPIVYSAPDTDYENLGYDIEFTEEDFNKMLQAISYLCGSEDFKTMSGIDVSKNKKRSEVKGRPS